MGANSTKIDSSEEEEIKLLLPKMFGVSNLKDIGVINKNKLQKVWSPLLTEGIISLYSTYVERKIISRKKFDDKKVVYFIYNTLVRGTTSEIAELLSSLFNVNSTAGTPPDECDSFSIEELTKYIANLFGSLINCLEDENDSSLKLWKKAGAGFDTGVENDVINYLLKDLIIKNNMVSRENLEVWLSKCPLFLTLQIDVLKKVFRYHDKIGPHQLQLPQPFQKWKYVIDSKYKSRI